MSDVLCFDSKQLCSVIIYLAEENVFSKIQKSVPVTCNLFNAMVCNLCKCSIHIYHMLFKKATWYTSGMSSQPTTEQCLQLTLCCCIFLSSLSISVHCHTQKRIKYEGKLLPHSWKKYQKRRGAELKNRTICLHLSHNYGRLFQLLWCQNPFKTWQIISQVRTHHPRRLSAFLKIQQDAHLKVREADALTSNFPTFHHRVSIIMQGY